MVCNIGVNFIKHVIKPGFESEGCFYLLLKVFKTSSNYFYVHLQKKVI